MDDGEGQRLDVSSSIFSLQCSNFLHCRCSNVPNLFSVLFLSVVQYMVFFGTIFIVTTRFIALFVFFDKTLKWKNETFPKKTTFDSFRGTLFQKLLMA